MKALLSREATPRYEFFTEELDEFGQPIFEDCVLHRPDFGIKEARARIDIFTQYREGYYVQVKYSKTRIKKLIREGVIQEIFTREDISDELCNLTISFLYLYDYVGTHKNGVLFYGHYRPYVRKKPLKAKVVDEVVEDENQLTLF